MNGKINGVTVRFRIFSGRRDPEWELDEEAVRKLKSLLEKTVKGERIDEAPTGGLGYRGFLVRCGPEVRDLPTDFIVFRGVLTENPGPKAVHRRDTGGVEEFLLAEARRQGYGGVIDRESIKIDPVGKPE
ncbi:MAG: hypothetical protein JSW52_01090 [Candidatus Coatesbacteria bacterium]|nr:MAG: hypothetical protein JSW52_01090 [Candidatus Coatesbacteria bacterium]